MTVGVVGAGITGLVLTHALAKRGADVVTFEAKERVGGVLRSDWVEGRLLEYGPQRIRRTPAIDELVTELGLGEKLLVGDDGQPLYVYADGRLCEVPRSLSGLLRTDLLSWRGKARLLAEPLTGPVTPDERADDVFRRKFGEEAYRNVIDPLFGGLYGSNPESMPAKYALSRLMALEDRHGSLLSGALDRLRESGERPAPISFRDGLQTLPEALYAANADRIHLGSGVERVIDGSGDSGYELLTGSGSESSRTVEDVVVTVPAHAAADVLTELPDATVAPLETLRYNPLAMVHLRSDAEAAGFGYQVRREEPLRTLGVTWNASLFDRDGVYTVFLGGMDDPDVVHRSASAIGTLASEEFTEVMDEPATVLDVTTWPRAIPAHDTSWAALDDLALPEGIHLATNYTGGIGVPSRVREAQSLAETLWSQT